MTQKKQSPVPTSFLQRLLLALISFYQIHISPRKPPSCRFTPTCSHYAKEVISTHGWYEGSRLAVNRITRCHPWHPGGFDPPP